MENELSPRFLVAALGDDGAWATPVRVRCTRCQGYSPPYGGASDNPEVPPTGEAPLGALNLWADGHHCGPALPPDAWANAGRVAAAFLKERGFDATVDDGVKAFASALTEVWDDVKKAAGDLSSAPRAGGQVDEDEALLRVTLYAVEDADFRAEWDRCVRDTADSICAEIAGRRMAGATEGCLDQVYSFPVPPGMDDQDAALAFGKAAAAAAQERVSRWSPSAGGPG